MRIHIISLILLFIVSSFGQIEAKEVIAKEVKLSLFNKPVTGYRLSLDKSTKFVNNQVIRHVSVHKAKPFQFEKTIIFENIIYPPITEAKEISLYYLLQSLPGGSTELTMVAMYDYKRSINTKDFPDLALKLLSDMADLLNKISGDQLRFEDMVIGGKELQAIAKAAENRKEEEKEDRLVEIFKEEEVENTNIRIKEDPFKAEAKKDSNSAENTFLTSLNEKIAQLEGREVELAKREKELQDQIALFKKREQEIEQLKAEKRAISDSLLVVNSALSNSQNLDLAGDEISSSNLDKKQIRDLETELATKNETLQKLQSSSDSLAEVLTNYTQSVSKLTTEKISLENSLRDIRSENALLKADYLIMKSKVSTGQPLSESAGNNGSLDNALRVENEALRDQVERMAQEIAQKDSELAQNKTVAIGMTAGRDTIVPKMIALRDTVKSLRQNLALAKAGNAQSAQLQDQLNALKQEKDKQQNQILALQQQNQALTRDKADVVSLNDQLETKLKLSLKTLKDLESSSGDMLGQIEAYNQNLASLQSDLDKVRTKMNQSAGEALTLKDSLLSSEGKNLRLKETVEDLSALNNKMKNEKASLNTQLLLQQKENQNLRANIGGLQSEIDSLKTNERPLSEQEQYVRALKVEVEKEKSTLDARKNQLDNREKLLSEREAKVDERLNEARKLELKYADLTAKEEQLKTREQRLKQAEEANQNAAANKEEPTVVKVESPPIGQSSGESFINGPVTAGKALEINQYVPVFTFESILTYKKTQAQIAAYMLKSGLLYDDKLPELIYKEVLIPEVSYERLTLKFRLEPSGAGTLVRASFKKGSGEYIALDDYIEDSQRVKKYLDRMFTFRF